MRRDLLLDRRAALDLSAEGGLPRGVSGRELSPLLAESLEADPKKFRNPSEAVSSTVRYPAPLRPCSLDTRDNLRFRGSEALHLRSRHRAVQPGTYRDSALATPRIALKLRNPVLIACTVDSNTAVKFLRRMTGVQQLHYLGDGCLVRDAFLSWPSWTSWTQTFRCPQAGSTSVPCSPHDAPRRRRNRLAITPDWNGTHLVESGRTLGKR